MAIAESNANASSKLQDHTRQFDVGENLAWGMDKPFDGWYTEEKENKRKGTGVTGHYENIINGDYEATGFAVNQYSNDYPSCCSQVFDFNDAHMMTIDELEADFRAWLKEIGYNG